MYVVVTIADNGVVHAWGREEDGTAWKTQGSARNHAERIKRQVIRDGHKLSEIQVKVCKILSDPDKDGTNDRLMKGNTEGWPGKITPS